MLFRLFLLLILVPIAELWLILTVHRAVAERIGTANAVVFTLGTIIVTGLVGASLARSQGLRALAALQEALARGEFPDRPLIDAVLIVAGGVMLLTPGYISDTIGLTLLIPWTRGLYRSGLASWLGRKVEQGRASISVRHVLGPGEAPGAPPGGPRGDDVVIDVTPEE